MRRDFELLRSWKFDEPGAFCRSLQRLAPEIRPDDPDAGGARVRAPALTLESDLVEDLQAG